MTGPQSSDLSTGGGGNLYASLDRSLAGARERTAIRSPSGDFRLSYGELRQGVARYANGLAALGVEPGDRVTVQTEKSVESVLLYLAVLKAGAVHQPLNPAYTDSEVDYFVDDAGPKVI